MTTLNFSKQEMTELRCIIYDTNEFKMTLKSYSKNYSDEEIKLAEKFLRPIFEKMNIYK